MLWSWIVPTVQKNIILELNNILMVPMVWLAIIGFMFIIVVIIRYYMIMISGFREMGRIHGNILSYIFLSIIFFSIFVSYISSMCAYWS
jgi:hypothetical protein